MSSTQLHHALTVIVTGTNEFEPGVRVHEVRGAASRPSRSEVARRDSHPRRNEPRRRRTREHILRATARRRHTGGSEDISALDSLDELEAKAIKNWQ